MNGAALAIMMAGCIAIASAAFGAGVARLFWADDLHHAQQIQASNREIAATNARTLEIIKSTNKMAAERGK